MSVVHRRFEDERTAKLRIGQVSPPFLSPKGISSQAIDRPGHATGNASSHVHTHCKHPALSRPAVHCCCAWRRLVALQGLTIVPRQVAPPRTGPEGQACTRWQRRRPDTGVPQPGVYTAHIHSRSRSKRERERERDYTYPALRLIQVLPGHPLADPKDETVSSIQRRTSL